MDEELKPCPFCGSEPKTFHGEDEDGLYAVIGCPSCGASSRQHYANGEEPLPHAVGAWNRRAVA